jgi:hypothetical protein
MSKIIREPFLRWKSDFLKKETAETNIRVAMAGRFLLSQLHERSSFGDHRGGFGFVLDVAGNWLERFSKTPPVPPC